MPSIKQTTTSIELEATTVILDGNVQTDGTIRSRAVQHRRRCGCHLALRLGRCQQHHHRWCHQHGSPAGQPHGVRNHHIHRHRQPAGRG